MARDRFDDGDRAEIYGRGDRKSRKDNWRTKRHQESRKQPDFKREQYDDDKDESDSLPQQDHGRSVSRGSVRLARKSGY